MLKVDAIDVKPKVEATAKVLVISTVLCSDIFNIVVL